MSDLRAIAEAATKPFAEDAYARQELLDDFDATFDPPTVLALLDVVEAARFARNQPLSVQQALARLDEIEGD